jgi:hypothetical protein
MEMETRAESIVLDQAENWSLLGLKFGALINLEKSVSKIAVRGPYFTTGGRRSVKRQHAQAFEVITINHFVVFVVRGYRFLT